MALKLKKSLKLNVVSAEPLIIGEFADKKPAYTKMTNIQDGLFIGDAQNAKNKEELLDAGITHIVNCTAAKCENFYPDHFTYLSLELRDKPEFDLSTYLLKAVDFIKKAIDEGGKVFIHCNQGISRAPSVLIAYYVWRYKVEAESCLEKLKEIYPKAEPNFGFLLQLDQFQKLVAKEPKKIANLATLTDNGSYEVVV